VHPTHHPADGVVLADWLHTALSAATCRSAQLLMCDLHFVIECEFVDDSIICWSWLVVLYVEVFELVVCCASELIVSSDVNISPTRPHTLLACTCYRV
jgi:hypothetical protein